MNQDNLPDDEKQLHQARAYWDNAAASFDDEPDHGLQDPQVRQAWIELLEKWLPTPGAAILDIGCGTGTLSTILAGLGHQVTGIDISPVMIARAKAKASAAGHPVEFQVMDAAAPGFSPETFGVIVCRHLLWALPDPATVLASWVELLKPGGRLILIEGYWHTGPGMHAGQIVAALPPSAILVSVEDLSSQPIYWGRSVTDERYAVITDRNPNSTNATYI